MEIQGKIMKLTGLSLYLEDKAILSLADKWKGKTAEELKGAIEFYKDIIIGNTREISQNNNQSS